MSHPIRRLALPLAALVAALLLLAGCGGDDGGLEGPSADAETDPQTILDNALGAEGETIESGVLELALDVQGGASGAVSAAVEGPFQSNGEDALPSIDFDVSVDAQTGGQPVAFEGNLTVTPDGLFVGYGGSEFELDDATFQLLQSSYEQSAQLQQDDGDAGGSLSQFGIDASTWLTDLTNEGTEDIEGTETVHVSGQADIEKLTTDLGTVAQTTGQALDPTGLQQLRDSVSSATIDVYADASNSSLRRLDVGLELTAPGGGGSEQLTFSIGIADPNSDQEIDAPDDAQPLEELIGQVPGLAESLGGIAGGTGTGTTPQASTPAPSPSSSRATEKYYDCVAGATSSQEIVDCQKLLGG
jgi:hypothetical protein